MRDRQVDWKHSISVCAYRPILPFLNDVFPLGSICSMNSPRLLSIKCYDSAWKSTKHLGERQDVSWEFSLRGLVFWMFSSNSLKLIQCLRTASCIWKAPLSYWSACVEANFGLTVADVGGLFLCSLGAFLGRSWGYRRNSNLVDSASSIRLSQRLSHACLSINKSIRETANGSLYQL